MNEHEIDVRALLTIDVDSELRKLSGAQLQGPWQIPAEAVRRALRSNAGDVDVRLGRHQATIADDGTGIPGELLQTMAVLLDRERPAQERHVALTTLEASGELVLLALAGLPCRLRIESSHAGQRVCLVHHEGKRPRLHTDPVSAVRGTEITVSSAALDRRQCAEWIASAARFAPGTVHVDGKPVAAGFQHALASTSLRPPLSGQVAVTAQGETAHVWLLEHGLVTGHVTLPDTPPFEAAVELGSGAHDLSAARVRDLFSAQAEDLVDQMVALLLELGRHPSARAEPVRARVARLVLEAARKRLRLDELVTIPILRATEDGAPTTLALVDIRRAAQPDSSGAHVVPALYPSQKPEHFALGSAPVLIVDPIERSRIAELMNVRFRPPDPKQSSRSVASIVRRAADRSSRAVARALVLLRHPIRRPALPDAQLDPRELALLVALRTALSESIRGVDMCAGRGPVRHLGTARPRLLLPRGNSDVRASVDAYARNPTWLYPITLTLLGGRELPPRELRKQWLTRMS